MRKAVVGQTLPRGGERLTGRSDQPVVDPRDDPRRNRAIAVPDAVESRSARALVLPVVTLTLVDPRYYHLDTALCVLGPDEIAYFPGAFSPASQAVLRELYPNAIIATASDAAVLGLNAVSDGYHVVLPAEAVDLAAVLLARGYQPVPVQLSELRKAGGGPKCCTLELRA